MTYMAIRRVFFLPKQSQKSISILEDGSRSLGMIRKGKTCITAIFYSTDLVICSHSRERKTLSYIDTIYDQYDHCQMVITIS